MKMLKLIACLLLLSVLAGCAQLRTSMVTTQDVNADIDGTPSPIVVKVYELSSAEVFNQSSFFALFDSPQATLGSSLLSLNEVVLVPADSKHVWFSLNPQTQYIGIVAGYRDLSHTAWRQVIPLDPNSSREMGFGMDISLSATGVSISKDSL